MVFTAWVFITIRRSNSMEMYPGISIITPSFNQGDFIEQTILSVLSQDYPNLEYLVIDGRSSDTTLQVLKKYSGKVSWISEADQGQTHAINKGLRRATGSIVGYLNADDLLLPGTLKKVAEVFINHPQVCWVTGKCRIVDEENNEIRRPITVYKNTLLGLHSFSLLLMTNYISQPATFWRREALESLGYLDENLHYVMDYEYWLRLYSKSPPVFIPEYLAAFKIHRSSKTTSTGHRDIYVAEEKIVVGRYVRSRFQLVLHNAHRLLMTFAYSLMNRG
jgi:glycosyltransferase involved in cell wall biosynthesis